MLAIEFLADLDLLLALRGSLALLFGKRIVTVRAADAFLVMGGAFVFVGDGVAAGVAHFVVAGLELMVDGYSIVEDETIAIPETFAGIDFCEIVEDAAIEVIDFFETLFE